MAKGKKAKKPKAAKPVAAKKGAARGRKETRESPGLGHNLAAIRKAIVPFADRHNALADTMDSDMAGYKADFNVLYEEAANSLGLKQSVISKELKRLRANKKAAEKEADMAPDEREQTELVRAAFEGTKYEKFTQGDLFPAVGAATEEEIEEASDPDNADEDDSSQLGDD